MDRNAGGELRCAAALAALVGLMLSASVWAKDARAPALDAADAEALVKVSRDVLSGRVGRLSDVPKDVVTPALRRRFKDEVSVTLFADRAPLIQYSSRGKSILDCAYRMMTQAAAMPGHLFYGFDQSDKIGFFVEVVTSRSPVKPEDWKQRLSQLDLGVEGIEINDRRRVLVYPGGKPGPKKRPKRRVQKRSGKLLPSRAVIGELDSRDRFIFRLCEKLKLYPSRRAVMPTGTHLWDKKTTKVHIVRTRTFLVLPGRTRARELFRVNVPTEPPSANSLLDAARGAADHICRRQKTDGRFFVCYNYATGQEFGRYNMVGHGLATEALLDLYERTRERRYLDAAVRAVRFALDNTRTDRKDRLTRRFVVFDEQAQLGCTAMTVTNLIRLSKLSPGIDLGAYDVAKTSRQLAQFLIDMQYDDGSFRYSYQYDRKVPFHYRVMPAHPDMAAWALLSLASHGRTSTYRDRAMLATVFLVGKREAHMNWQRPPAFTWLARTLRKLCERKKDARFAEYLYRMADNVVAGQYLPEGNRGPDVVGAYSANAPDLVTATACKMVIVSEAALLARQLQDSQRAGRYAKSIRLASGFLAANRFGPENAFYLSDPDKATGAFRAGIFRTTTRLNTNAYAIQACLELEKLLTDGPK